MTQTSSSKALSSLTTELTSDMTELYGPLMHSKQLWKVLGYGSADSFRHALNRKSIPIPVFSIEGRKGNFALTKEVSAWLAEQRLKNVEGKES